MTLVIEAAAKAQETPAEVRKKTGITVVIPVLDEQDAIGAVVTALRQEAVDEVIVADGGSRDRTVDIAKACGARIVHAGKGYGRACLAGALAAGEDCRILVFMDGDGSDVTSELPRLALPIAAGTHDFVIASRARGKREPGSMAWHQLAAGRIIGVVIGWTSGQHYTDMCAYRAIRRDMFMALDMREMTYGWNLEMQMKAAYRGWRIMEIAVPYARRIGGESKVAGSLRGTVKAGSRILRTLVGISLSMRRDRKGQLRDRPPHPAQLPKGR
jgi:glycosyltransferase involved in cell wall biosynthesis